VEFNEGVDERVGFYTELACRRSMNYYPMPLLSSKTSCELRRPEMRESSGHSERMLISCADIVWSLAATDEGHGKHGLCGVRFIREQKFMVFQTQLYKLKVFRSIRVEGVHKFKSKSSSF
jgi:hypothetical protein